FIGARDPFQSETFVIIEGDDHLYRTGTNLRNIMEMNPKICVTIGSSGSIPSWSTAWPLKDQAD
ncbi:MAG: hypothetical protein ABIK28_14050, partial [Planctomycetota bacterium]